MPNPDFSDIATPGNPPSGKGTERQVHDATSHNVIRKLYRDGEYFVSLQFMSPPSNGTCNPLPRDEPDKRPSLSNMRFRPEEELIQC
jgi:hypothetical protein